jgi:mannosyltransferase OCH1-like enzyme
VIPKVLHRIWFGDRERPRLYDHYWQEWQNLHPDWELKTWTEDNLDGVINQQSYDDVAVSAKSGGTPMSHGRAVAVMRADIVAYELVYRHGGVYVNCDVFPLKSFDPLLVHTAFMGMEDDVHICNAVMGGEPGHRLYGDVIERLPLSVIESGGGGMELATGPQFLTRVWRSDPDYDLTVLPVDAFYPVHHSNVPVGTTDFRPFIDMARAKDSYACHIWGHRSQEGELSR